MRYKTAFNDLQKGNLPIWAVRNSNLSALRLLHEFEADLDQCDDSGWSPLVYSIIHNDMRCLKLLLELECNVENDREDFGGWTPVIFCSLLNNHEALHLLAEHRANLDHFIFSKKNALILCAERGFYQCLDVLLKFNVERNVDALSIVKQSLHKEITPNNRKRAIGILSQYQ